MERISREAIADHFGVNVGAAGFGVLILFKNNDTCTLTHNKAITVYIIGARGFLRFVIKVG